MGYLFRTGELINERYRVQRILGSGATGAVYLCVDELIGSTKVALKAFHPSATEDPAARVRIQRELLVSSSVQHHNIVRTLEAFWHGEVLAFAMEYAPGETLRNLVAARGPLPADEVTWILCQICNGLSALHAQRLVHRDMTSNNVIVGPGNTVKITDLGLVREPIELRARPEGIPKVNAFARTCATLDGQMAGTPLYLSPEYVLDGRCDALSDIYGVGIIGYELLTGAAPFQELELNELFAKKTSESAPSVQELRPELPTKLTAAIDRAIALEPSQRFQSAKEMHEALAGLLRSALPGQSAVRRNSGAHLVEASRATRIDPINIFAAGAAVFLIALAAYTAYALRH